MITAITGLFVGGILHAQDQPAGKTNSEIPGVSETDKTFTAAFNRGDAQAVAAHWTEDGDYVDENGQKYHGRAAIEKEYKNFFTAYPGVKIKLEVKSLRKIDQNNAIEDGYATLDPQPQGIPARSRYTAMHTRKNGKWLMTAVRDSRVPLPADPGQLAELDFLVGTWTVEQDGTRLETKYRWINDKHLLERWYTAHKGEKLVSHGRQMIGWDPLAGRIVSWTFTSEGGFAAGAWVPMEDGWAVATVGVLQDRTLTSSTDIWSQPNKESVSWKSVNRTKGDVALPDMQEVVLKRKQE
ncbi:MAG: SgcJ/EcaC family oxidoreductase [Planctomycetota bacterium]|nr:SgcJ/EcaC family oxidoreductase [Planctomycetota bacterium]